MNISQSKQKKRYNTFQITDCIMGHIKEPEGVDFVVDPTPLTTEERNKISEIIAYYKRTGRKMPLKKEIKQISDTKKTKKVTV